MIKELQKAVDYIDANIDIALNLDMISKHIGFSKYYLNHVFSIYTGFSIMAFRLHILERMTSLKREILSSII